MTIVTNYTFVFFFICRKAKTMHQNAKYSLRHKCISNLQKLINDFSNDGQFTTLVTKPNVDLVRLCAFIAVINSHLVEYQNDRLLVKNEEEKFNRELSYSTNCLFGIDAIKQSFQLFKAIIDLPSLDTVESLLILEKLTDVIYECVSGYIQHYSEK